MAELNEESIMRPRFILKIFLIAMLICAAWLLRDLPTRNAWMFTTMSSQICTPSRAGLELLHPPRVDVPVRP